MKSKDIKEALILVHASKIDKIELLRTGKDTRESLAYVGKKAYVRKFNGKETYIGLIPDGFIPVLHDTTC